MNDQGLFMDMNAVKPTGWHDKPGKPSFQGDLVEQILSHYSTVDEVVEFFQQHNVPDLNILRVPVADSKGNSAIVEWGKGQLQLLYKEGYYQISTNFIQSDYGNPEEYPCKRYKIADRILGEATAALVFTKGEPTKKVWFYEMNADGYSLDDKRTFIDGKGDIPDIINKFYKRDTEAFEDRKANCFFVPIEEIKENNYDLSISRYKEIQYEEPVYEEPEVIRHKILDLENKIIKGLQEIPSTQSKEFVV